MCACVCEPWKLNWIILCTLEAFFIKRIESLEFINSVYTYVYINSTLTFVQQALIGQKKKLPWLYIYTYILTVTYITVNISIYPNAKNHPLSPKKKKKTINILKETKFPWNSFWTTVLCALTSLLVHLLLISFSYMQNAHSNFYFSFPQLFFLSFPFALLFLF